MSPLRAMIVDDEELARSVLRELLGAQPSIEVVAESANGFDAVKQVAEARPDVLFLDIQMPKLNGFEVLELIDAPPAVIFVTAYDEYAMRAFDVHAVDYLLKPVSPQRFESALERAKLRLNSALPHATDLKASARPPGQYLERLVIKDGPRVHIVPLSKVDYLEAQDDYIAVHADGKTHLKQQTLSSIESSLDPDLFVKIHRSYLLNVDKLARLEPYGRDSKVAILRDGTQLPVSQSGLARLTKALS